MLVEAETADGLRHSTLLQNAETVRLIGPSKHSIAAASSSDSKAGASQSTDGPAAQQQQQQQLGQQQWKAIAVTELQPGQQVFLLRQDGARHTGISIQENINEK